MSDDDHIGPIHSHPAHARPAGATEFENDEERRLAWRALWLLGIVQLMVVLDASITNVALPTIGEELNMDETDLSWVINAYVLVFGGFLLLGGRLGDLFGRRKLFMIGLVVFSLGSLLGGLSSEPWQIIAARAFQGLGGALLAPAVLSITAALFPEGKERNKAFGVLGGIAGSGGAIGVLLGGVLTEKLGWEWVFYVNVPIGMLAFLLAPMLLAESRDESEERSSDVFGAITVTAGITLLVYALVDTDDVGWGSGQTIGLLLGAAALLGLFWWIESTVRKPLIRLGIFRNPAVTGANIVSVVVGAALFSMFYFLAFYMQRVLDYGPLETGVRYLPMSVSIILAAGFSSVLTTKVGFRKVLYAGLVLTIIGLVWLTQLSVDGTFVGDVLGPSIVAGVGLGFVFVPLTLAAVSGVAQEETGLASGLINTTQQVGAAVGLGVLLTQFSSVAEEAGKEKGAELAKQAEAAGGGPAPSAEAAQAAAAKAKSIVEHHALTEGIQAAFWGGVAFAVVGLILAVVLLRNAEAPAQGLAAHPM